MSVYVNITARVAPGKFTEASAYLRRYAEEIEKQTGVEVLLLGEVGEINSVMVASTYDSLADVEKAIGGAWGNEAYRKLLDDASGLFVPGEGETHIFMDTGG